MTKFTNILPPPSPFNEGPQYIAINRKNGIIKSPLSDLQLAVRFGVHWANQNNGDDYVWAVLTPETHKALLQPAPVATDDGERERLRSSIRTAMNRIDAASGLLDSAFEDLTEGLLEGGT